MENKKEKFILEDENGNQKELDPFFTYHSDNFSKDYIVFVDPDDEENLIAASYVEKDGKIAISDIETDEEYDELDEVIEAYQTQEEIPVVEEEK